jgi:hypothetical protein
LPEGYQFENVFVTVIFDFDFGQTQLYSDYSGSVFSAHLASELARVAGRSKRSATWMPDQVRHDERTLDSQVDDLLFNRL